MPASILVDDEKLTSGSDYFGESWQRRTNQNGAFNGTVTVWTPGKASVEEGPPLLIITTDGSDLNIYGTVSNNMVANYSVDFSSSSTSVVFPTGLPVGKTGVDIIALNMSMFSQSLISHSTTISPIGGQLIFDYVTYTPTSTSILDGVDLILDDTDSAIQYSESQWNHTDADFDSGRPYQQTLTGTNIIGATMNLTFVGSDIAVYGALNEVDGRLSASFSVDGQTSTDFKPFNGSQTVNGSSWKTAQQLFRQNLSSGQHTLVVTLTDISANQMLWIDSIVYLGTDGTTLNDGEPPSPFPVPGSSDPVPAPAPEPSLSFNPVNDESGPPFPKPAIIGFVSAGIIFLLAVYRGIRLHRIRAARRQIIIASAPITQGPFPPPPPLPHPMVNSIHWQTTSPNVPNWNWQYPPMSGVPVSPVSHIDSSNSPSMFVATPIDALMDGANPDERETVVVPAPDNHMHDGRD